MPTATKPADDTPSSVSASRPLPLPSTVSSLLSTSAAVYADASSFAVSASSSPVTSDCACVCEAAANAADDWPSNVSASRPDPAPSTVSNFASTSAAVYALASSFAASDAARPVMSPCAWVCDAAAKVAGSVSDSTPAASVAKPLPVARFNSFPVVPLNIASSESTDTDALLDRSPLPSNAVCRPVTSAIACACDAAANAADDWPSSRSASRPLPLPSTVSNLLRTSAAVYEALGSFASNAVCRPVTSAIRCTCTEAANAVEFSPSSKSALIPLDGPSTVSNFASTSAAVYALASSFAASDAARPVTSLCGCVCPSSANADEFRPSNKSASSPLPDPSTVSNFARICAAESEPPPPIVHANSSARSVLSFSKATRSVSPVPSFATVPMSIGCCISRCPL